MNSKLALHSVNSDNWRRVAALKVTADHHVKTGTW